MGEFKPLVVRFNHQTLATRLANQIRKKDLARLYKPMVRSPKSVRLKKRILGWPKQTWSNQTQHEESLEAWPGTGSSSSSSSTLEVMSRQTSRTTCRSSRVQGQFFPSNHFIVIATPILSLYSLGKWDESRN